MACLHRFLIYEPLPNTSWRVKQNSSADSVNMGLPVKDSAIWEMWAKGKIMYVMLHSMSMLVL